jgi:hypothetical protein
LPKRALGVHDGLHLAPKDFAVKPFTSLVCSLTVLAACLPGQAMAAPPPATATASAGWDRVVTLMKAAVALDEAGDHAKAAGLMAEAEAVIAAEEGAFTTFRDRLGRSDIALSHARALRAGRLGDPCPLLAQSRRHALQAQDMTANDGEVERRDMVRQLLAEIDAEGRTAQCAAPAAAKVDPAFAGHYYLSGVMETGSELLLRGDGTFDWYISYGAVDQAAKGQWASDGAAVVLTATTRDTSRPLFAALDVEGWGVEAEQELLDRQAEAARAEVEARCPFLGDTAAATSPAMLAADAVTVRPSPAELTARAALAETRTAAARAKVEALAAAAVAAMPPGGAVPEADAAPVRQAMAAWQEARAALVDAQREAGVPENGLDEPAMPPACTALPASDASSLPRDRWTGGLAVRVVDPASRQGMRRVRVTVHFADGHTAGIETAARGLAILPGTQPSAVTSVTLAADYAPGRDQTIAVAPLKSGILHFSLDAGQLNAAPFDTMRLRIDGAALVPDSFGRGRYERGQ